MSSKQSGRRSVKGPTEQMKRRTLLLMAVCGIVAFIVLAFQLFKIQIIEHDKYEADALSQQIGTTSSIAERGTIYDTNMKALAMSSEVYTVFIDPKAITERNEDINLIADELNELLDVDRAEVISKMENKDSQYAVVARKVDPDIVEKIKTFKNVNNITTVHFEKDYKRYYPYGSLACHVVGFTGSDGTGLQGVEYEYNSVLSGAEGRKVQAQTANGKPLMFTEYEDNYTVKNGLNVVTTIDSTIQYYLEKRLQEAVEKYDIQNGAGAIVMNVKSGAILGMASLGNFDLNDYLAVDEETQKKADAASDKESDEIMSEARSLMWRNKCISDTYEPGSTFKILTLAMALQEGIAPDESDEYFCEGSVQVEGDTVARHCWDVSGHGEQTLTQAVQHSCNVAFVNIGQKIGAERFYKYCDAFGLLNLTPDKEESLTGLTGVDLPGEARSIWWSENVFYNPEVRSQLAAASFGQTFNVTPLQMVTAVSACVNGGYLVEPYVVRELVDDNGDAVYTHDSTPVRQVISEETSDKICEILEKVVNDPVDGTGKNAYVAGYRIGGKTGTSEKVSKLADTGEKEYIVSFMGIAPADEPEIAILAFLDTPNDEGETYISGGQMGAPTVGAMLSDILPYIGVEAQYSEEEILNRDRGVPDVLEKKISDAAKALEDSGMRYRVIGEGDTVTKQLPAAHSVIAAGSEVILYADEEPSKNKEKMIDLIDYDYVTAREKLSQIGVFISTSSPVSDPDSQLITSQSIAEGEEVEHGTIINVTLRSGGGGSMIGRY